MPESTGSRARAVAGAVAAAVIFSVLLSVLFRITPTRSILSEVVLQSERGVVTLDRPLATAQRLWLDLRIERPAAIVVYLVDPEGQLSDVYPNDGRVERLSSPQTRVPPGDATFETASLRDGSYLLFIVGAAQPLSRERRAELTERLREGLRAVLRSEISIDRLPVEVEAAFEEESLEIVPRQFALDRKKR